MKKYIQFKYLIIKFKIKLINIKISLKVYSRWILYVILNIKEVSFLVI